MEIKAVNPKGNQSWIFIGRTDAEAETPIFWPPDANYWLTGKDPDAEQDWRQKEKETTEDEMVGWHHRLNGHEFEQAPGVGDGQGSWCAVVHGVAKSRTWLSDWTELMKHQAYSGCSITASGICSCIFISVLLSCLEVSMLVLSLPMAYKQTPHKKISLTIPLETFPSSASWFCWSNLHVPYVWLITRDLHFYDPPGVGRRQDQMGPGLSRWLYSGAGLPERLPSILYVVFTGAGRGQSGLPQASVLLRNILSFN